MFVNVLRSRMAPRGANRTTEYDPFDPIIQRRIEETIK